MSGRRFVGKAALVTGAASGIGKATAERLGAEGGDLVLADVNAEGVRAVATRIAESHGVRTQAIIFNAADPESCRSLVEEAVGFHGRLDVLCNIAGVMDWDNFLDFTPARWDRMIAINLTSVFHMCQQAMPHLLATKGNIVNMASVSGLSGIAYSTAYCASKAGVVAITKSLAVEFASREVRINAVCPGGVRTPLAENLPPPAGIEMKLIDRIFPKLGKGESLPNRTTWRPWSPIGSDEARYITGATFVIDGGQLAG